MKSAVQIVFPMKLASMNSALYEFNKIWRNKQKSKIPQRPKYNAMKRLAGIGEIANIPNP